MDHKTALAIMAKQPVVGKTKTRLCPFLSAQEATQLYEALLLDTMGLAGWLGATVDLAVAVSPPESRAYFERIAPPGVKILLVAGADIGECLEQTLGALFAAGYQKALALNSDGPDLPLAYLQKAIQLLDQADIVLGPCLDGGYYLVGMRQLYGGIFRDIAWSTEKVFAQTLGRAVELNLTVALTPPWYDIDIPQDLLRLEAELLSEKPENLPYTRAILQRLALYTRTG
jgi:uncharacterized protein